MTTARSIFLIGPMGSGKSAVGRRLARDLGMAFFDVDEEVQTRTGVDIPFIFEKEGEAGFRNREKTMLAELASQPGIVLATGGGSPQDTDNRAVLAKHGTVVYLYTSVPEQLRRIGKSRQRPLLNTDNPGAVLEALMQKRDPLYREIADIVIETDGRQVAAVAREIKKALADTPSA